MQQITDREMLERIIRVPKQYPLPILSKMLVSQTDIFELLKMQYFIFKVEYEGEERYGLVNNYHKGIFQFDEKEISKAREQIFPHSNIFEKMIDYKKDYKLQLISEHVNGITLNWIMQAYETETVWHAWKKRTGVVCAFINNLIPIGPEPGKTKILPIIMETT